MSALVAAPAVTRAWTCPNASVFVAMPPRSSSPRIASSTAHSWYGAVGGSAMRCRTERTSSGSIERGTAREDIVHQRCYGSTTRGGAAPSPSSLEHAPRPCTSAASRPTTPRTSVMRARSSSSTSWHACSRPVASGCVTPRPEIRRIPCWQDDARLDDPSRRSPLDFALWRRVSVGPTWPSPFGRGRPGWHLECSAMSDRHLGFPIDIHGGGSDLVYPHHECETAQSEAAHGMKTRFVGHWVHVAPMRLGGAKMSKSDGNMVFVRDALKKTSPQALRLYLLDVHYRRAFDHDADRLARAGRRADALAKLLGRGRLGPIENDASTQNVLAALDDDLHAERAIRALERHARRDLAPDSWASLRTIARKVLGIL